MSDLFKRKYKVVVVAKSGQGLEVSNLHCTFTVEKSMASRPNYSSLRIFNLAPNSRGNILSSGSRIMIEAGYERAQYGLIYDGDIVQAYSYADDNVSEVTEILSQDGDIFLNGSFMSASYSAGETASSLLSTISGLGDPNMAVGSVSENLSGTQFARGRVLFGQPKDIARGLAKGEGGLFYVNDRKINLIKPEDIPPGEIISLSPDSGLVGVPEQTDTGVKAKCLLNPLLNLNALVYIDNSLVKQQVKSVGQAARRMASGVYRILTLTHTGDTRGNDWYTEFTGIAQPGTVPVSGKSFIK